MHRTRVLALAAGVALILLGATATRRTASDAAPPPVTSAAVAEPVVIRDHHVHILGPDVIRDWKSLGVPFSRPDSVYLSAATLLRDRPDTVLHAVLVPMAHLYGNPEFLEGLRIPPDSARARVRRENIHVAREAARFPGRAVALCSVPALAPWALDELQWCTDSLRVAGIKLHLASAGVDLRRAADLDAVAAIAGFAHGWMLPLLLHVDTQTDSLHHNDVLRFADRVLGPHPRLTVVIAHLGGSGGYGDRTRLVFRALRAWRTFAERHDAPRGRARDIHFELSAVVLERESEGVPLTTAEEAAQLRDDLRATQFDRVLLGSDYPVFDPVRTLELLRDRVGLRPDELALLARGRGAPRFPWRGAPLVR